MKKYKILTPFIFILMASILSIGCREEYNPNIDPADTNLLVVEGFIATNGERSVIRLSRTGNLNDSTFNVEPGALVELEGENNGTWRLLESPSGTYSMSTILPSNQQYRLRISLRNNDEYLSDLMQPLESPEIAELSWRRTNSGVTIRVNTQGSQENPYFLWQFEEDWRFRSAIPTSYRYLPDRGVMEEVTPETNVSVCWNENRVQRVIIENSARFSNNQILDREINLIPNSSEKLGLKYSILVRQIAIDRNAFDFWEIMRKNTEDIGGIFSPLPSLIGGNIKKVGDENISAIGYISMGVATEKRIFITNQEVSPWSVSIQDYDGCAIRPDTIAPRDYADYFTSGNLMPVNPIFGGNTPSPTAFQAATKFCVDCTERGGTLIRPDFWED
ncbi:DUF4249 domain-containing protein [Belliella sp. DSM 107340]|uniref:DUF4249 domain-containing protein n=1 Tax=Belliella calami TaxID=2923436 RepID=A0ABS9UNM3_9BACT|nr:DUF4249 domain-containing protein [Belliella calami]MCH7397974.1 DUF4249 domain-containing protein [Belliella calami]